MDPRFGVIVVAGGSSRRMEGLDKQTLLLENMPVLARSIRPFGLLEEVGEIVVVCRRDQISTVEDYVSRYELQKVSRIVPGGESRPASVREGLRAFSQSWDWLLIHDGARPFASRELIRRCMADAWRYGAATAAIPARDTVKVSDGGGFIQSTPPRSLLYQVQTPQLFRWDWYQEALAQAQEGDTDDCQLLERAGRKVDLSRGSSGNMKITTPEDLPAARALARALDEEEGYANWSRL